MTEDQRMKLVNDTFMSEWLDGYCFGVEGEEDQFELAVIEALDQTFVAVILAGAYIDRVWVNSDGTVWAASGQDDPFLPQVDFHNQTDMSKGGRWYCGDEIEQIGKDFKFKYGAHEWSSTMCIPKVKTYGLTPETYAFLSTKWFLEYPEKRMESE